MNNNGDHAAVQYSTSGLTMDLYNLNMTSVAYFCIVCFGRSFPVLDWLWHMLLHTDLKLLGPS